MSDRDMALVTGGGTGIGRAVCLALAARGYWVVVSGRRPEPLEETVTAIRAGGGVAEALHLDVTNQRSVQGAFRWIAAQQRRLAVLVANAGAFRRGEVAEQPFSEWTGQIDVNLNGVFVCLQAAIRLMRKQDPVDGSCGHLFTINSGAGVSGFPTGAAYAASKHAVRGLVDSLRPEVARYGIKVTDIVVSATVETPMSAGRNVEKILPDTVGHTVVSCLELRGAANWDRVDLTQLLR